MSNNAVFAQQKLRTSPAKHCWTKNEGRDVPRPKFFWRRHPDLNRGSGCCRPTPYHLAIAPVFAFVNTQLLFTKTKNLLPPLLQELGIAYSEYRKNIPTNYWSGLRGSNSLPPPWQGGALPDELNPHLYKRLSP